MTTKYIDDTELTLNKDGYWVTTGIDGQGNNWSIDIIYDEHGAAYYWRASCEQMSCLLDGNNSELEEAFGEACQQLDNYFLAKNEDGQNIRICLSQNIAKII